MKRTLIRRNKPRKKTHGFRARMRRGGKVIKSRRQKGRKVLSA